MKWNQVFGGVFIVAMLAGFGWFLRAPPQAPQSRQPPMTVEESMKQAEAEQAQKDQEAFLEQWREKNLRRAQTSFADAPMDIKVLLTAIVMGRTPSDADLAKFTKEEINQTYPLTEGEFGIDQGYTDNLLREALLSRNFPAAEALVRHGADVTYNEDELAFDAITTRTAFGPEDDNRIVPFPDYSFGNQFLTLYLENGGGPNAYDSEAGFSLLTDSSAEYNLQAVLILLAHNADPWFQVPDKGSDYLNRSFLTTIANTSKRSLEITFRVAEAGYYDNLDLEKLDELLKKYQQYAHHYIGITGPDGLWRAWALQKVLKPILKGNHSEPTGDIAELMAMKIPDDVGGFYLAPGQLWSPPGTPQIVADEFGTEKWDG
ncbi:hypothetical protein [Martelella soudanensis]|uniref:hypothetical protein n=1 Tax=unclassified Martelella TaxID=2629616 RepID=UPI0015DFD71D|nr:MULTISPECIES: hypothetical protein [unclassified Martelella]